MEEIITAIDDNIQSEAKIMAVVIIKGEKNIEHSTPNWDISDDIDDINLHWKRIERDELRFTELIKKLDEENRLFEEKGILNQERIDELMNKIFNWKPKVPSFIKICKIEYRILQWTPERILAKNFEGKGSIVGYKDDERKIFYRVEPDGMLDLGLTDAAKTLWKLRSKEPYMDPDASLGKVDQLKWTTPRILLDDTNNLQELGLLKFGLSIEEAKVYLGLLRKGGAGDTVGKLNKKLEIKRTTIYRIMDRLIDKGWVMVIPAVSEGGRVYIARPLSDILDERIQQREEELKIMKSLRFIMGETFKNGWINLSEIDKEGENKAYNFKTLGITGVEKDCGLLIFEYGSSIENDIIIQAALQLSCEKLRLKLQVDEDIEEYTNPDLKEVKFDDTKFEDYLGAIMYLKFEKGSKTANNVGTNWITAAQQVAIPVEDKIHVIWGTQEKFPEIMEIISKLY